jgi:hypothetical protein
MSFRSCVVSPDCGPPASPPAPQSGITDGATAPDQTIVSIYATLWRLQFPCDGDLHVGQEWMEVVAQGVPAHVGTSATGYGYESGDPYAAFLPPAIRIEDDTPEDELRAVVFVTGTAKKGTARSGQEYESPLLVLSGAEYAAMSFQVLHDRLCSALRGDRPSLVMQAFAPDGSSTLIFDDGSTAPGPALTSDKSPD